MDNLTSLEKIDVAGLLISPVTKQFLLDQIRQRTQRREKTFVVTPYSEFLYASLLRPEVRSLLNSADFAVADGIGILWADLFLTQPLPGKYFYGKMIRAVGQIIWTGASILLKPQLLYRRIPEKIVGADLIWDLAQLAADHNFTMFLLGGRGRVAEQAGERLRAKFPNLKIVGTSNKNYDDPSIIDEVNAARPDFLLVAFNPLIQEQWLSDNLSKTTASFGIALGGTFDYLAGAKKAPPRFIRTAGLEWLWRLFTQPSRLVRIYRAFWGLITALLKFKVYGSMPYRQNAVAIVRNRDGKILLCRRAPNIEKVVLSKDFTDYWQFPQGGLDRGEDLVAGAKRELNEETGILSAVAIQTAQYINRYTWNNGNRRLFTHRRYWYRGQEQGTVFFQFIGDDSEIKLDDRELVEFCWLTPDEVLEKIAPERRPHAAAVLAELKEIQV